MKIQIKLLLLIGSAALASLVFFLISAYLTFRVELENVDKMIAAKGEKDFRTIALKEAAMESKELESKIRRLFQCLDGLPDKINSKDTKIFAPYGQAIISFVAIEKAKKEIIIQNPMSIRYFEKGGIIQLLEFMESSTRFNKRSALLMPEKTPEFLLIAIAENHGEKGRAFVVDVPVLLKSKYALQYLPKRTQLYCGKAPSAAFTDENFNEFKNYDFPQTNDLLKLINGISTSNSALSEREIMHGDKRFKLIISNLNVPSCVPTGIRFGIVFPQPDNKSYLMTSAAEKHLLTLLLLIMVCASLIITIPLIIVSRNLFLSIRQILRFSESVTKGKASSQKLVVDYCKEFSDTAANLNLLRDKVNSLGTRLFRSHDRENEIRQEMENKRLFRAALIMNIMKEQGYPMNTAACYSEMIMKTTKEPETQASAKEIHDHIFELSKLQKVLADLAFLESTDDRLASNTTTIHPMEILHKALRTFVAEAQAKQISIESHTASAIPEQIRTDYNILLNLLQISAMLQVQAAPCRSQIQIGCRRTEDQLIFWSEAENEEKTRTFADLLKMPSNPSGLSFKNGEAAAMLLLLCLQREAKQVQAELQIEAIEDSNLIQIKFPLSLILDFDSEKDKQADSLMLSVQHNTEHRIAKKIRLNRGEKARLMILDPSAEESTLLATLLNDSSFQVARADSESTALELLTSNIFDVILIDAGGKNIRELIEISTRLRKTQTAPIAIVIMSTKNISAEKLSEYSNGIDAVLEKPLLIDKLSETLHSFLEIKE